VISFLNHLNQARHCSVDIIGTEQQVRDVFEEVNLQEEKVDAQIVFVITFTFL